MAQWIWACEPVLGWRGVRAIAWRGLAALLMATGTMAQPAVLPSAPMPPVTVLRISEDPFVSPVPGQHASEVEPAAAAHGGTVLAAFQVGRLLGGGSVAIGWARWQAGHWRHGLLPGLTAGQRPPGPYRLVSDPSVAYDAARGRWLIAILAIAGQSHQQRTSVLVARSPDGTHWGGRAYALVATAAPGGYDKPWIACDNTARSPYYGRCYATWDRSGRVDRLVMSTSRDGGATWGAPATPTGGPAGLGGEPVVQRSGVVIVPTLGELRRGVAIIAVTSHDGGVTWGPATLVSRVRHHPAAGGLRAGPLPSVAIDGADRVYVAWPDCRFEPGCGANDIVLSSSTDGLRWAPVARVPITARGSGADYVLAGLGASPTGGSAQAQLVLTYYAYPRARCTRATCRLGVGAIASADGGATWDGARRLTDGMSLAWLATSGGAMVGDYLATVVVPGAAWGIFAAARAPHAGRLDEAMYGAFLPVPAVRSAKTG